MARPTCFIAMPLTTAPAVVGQYGGDLHHFIHVLDHLFLPAVDLAGYEPVKPLMTGADVIQGEIIKNLVMADMVLCDISGHNPNVFFELGIRTALDRPVALIRDNLTEKLPFDTSIVNTATYDSSLSPWMLEGEVKDLAAHVRITGERSAAKNALWGFFGIAHKASERIPSGNPLEAKIDLLTANVAVLKDQVFPPEHVPSRRAAAQMSAIARQAGVSMRLGLLRGGGVVARTESGAVDPELERQLLAVAAANEVRIIINPDLDNRDSYFSKNR